MGISRIILNIDMKFNNAYFVGRIIENS